jgi:hypothetical protein
MKRFLLFLTVFVLFSCKKEEIDGSVVKQEVKSMPEKNFWGKNPKHKIKRKKVKKIKHKRHCIKLWN